MSNMDNQQTPSKVLTFTRVLSAATGNVSYTGFGFQPRSVKVKAKIAGTTAISQGFAVVAPGACHYSDSTAAAFGTEHIAACFESAIAYQLADLVSLDVDGITLAWTKTGVPTVTASLVIEAHV